VQDTAAEEHGPKLVLGYRCVAQVELVELL
jgi:hypothetical protein